MTRGTIIATGLATVGLAGGALAVAAPTQAAIDEASTTLTAATSPCRKLATAHQDTIRLWYCNGTGGTKRGYHAQGYLNNGSNIVLRTKDGQSVGYAKNTTGGVLPRWFNTGTFWMGGPTYMRACSGTLCTAAAR
jgi:hypothetical protein